MAENTDIKEFSFEDLKDAGKHTRLLGIPDNSGGKKIGLPLLFARGVNPGKTLVATASVHGDELEGVQAIQDVFRDLDTNKMSGDLIAVPVANPPAFYAVQRESPLDGLNLARTFPGDENGSPTEQIAFYLGTKIIPQGDFYLDLHSAFTSLMPTMVGYDASDTEAGKKSKDAALRMGTPVIWGHPDLGPGRTLSVAADHGIPWLYMESSSGARVSADKLPFYKNTLLNLLGYLGIIDRETPVSKPELHLIGSGDVDTTQAVRSAGFFVQKVSLLDRVEKGDLIAEVRDLFGEVIEEVTADQTGYVSVLRSNPLVTEGDTVCLISGSIE
ncbi:MAG: succinylglutamate desuccinylase/aspartoacylase family protein [Pyrinomonadaceae bacterium]